MNIRSRSKNLIQSSTNGTEDSINRHTAPPSTPMTPFGAQLRYQSRSHRLWNVINIEALSDTLGLSRMKTALTIFLTVNHPGSAARFRKHPEGPLAENQAGRSLPV